LLQSVGTLSSNTNTNTTHFTTIADVQAGRCDGTLKVPWMVVAVAHAQMLEGTWTLQLRDATEATIDGFLPADAAKANPDMLFRGASVLLQHVSIFVSKEVDGNSRFKRYLNLHRRCIVAVQAPPAKADDGDKDGDIDIGPASAPTRHRSVD
jgi:Homologous recombination OB-fold protein